MKVKRAYEPLAGSKGNRFLVDRLWLRGVTKDALRVQAWLKDVAPSDAPSLMFTDVRREKSG